MSHPWFCHKQPEGLLNPWLTPQASPPPLCVTIAKRLPAVVGELTLFFFSWCNTNTVRVLFVGGSSWGGASPASLSPATRRHAGTNSPRRQHGPSAADVSRTAVSRRALPCVPGAPGRGRRLPLAPAPSPADSGRRARTHAPRPPRAGARGRPPPAPPLPLDGGERQPAGKGGQSSGKGRGGEVGTQRTPLAPTYALPELLRKLAGAPGGTGRRWPRLEGAHRRPPARGPQPLPQPLRTLRTHPTHLPLATAAAGQEQPSTGCYQRRGSNPQFPTARPPRGRREESLPVPPSAGSLQPAASGQAALTKRQRRLPLRTAPRRELASPGGGGGGAGEGRRWGRAGEESADWALPAPVAALPFPAPSRPSGAGGWRRAEGTGVARRGAAALPEKRRCEFWGRGGREQRQRRSARSHPRWEPGSGKAGPATRHGGAGGRARPRCPQAVGRPRGSRGVSGLRLGSSCGRRSPPRWPSYFFAPVLLLPSFLPPLLVVCFCCVFGLLSLLYTPGRLASRLRGTSRPAAPGGDRCGGGCQVFRPPSPFKPRPPSVHLVLSEAYVRKPPCLGFAALATSFKCLIRKFLLIPDHILGGKSLSFGLY